MIRYWRYFGLMVLFALILTLAFCAVLLGVYSWREAMICVLATIWDILMFTLLIILLSNLFPPPANSSQKIAGCLKAVMCLFGKVVLIVGGLIVLRLYLPSGSLPAIIALCLGLSTIVLAVIIVGGFLAITIRERVI